MAAAAMAATVMVAARSSSPLLFAPVRRRQNLSLTTRYIRGFSSSDSSSTSRVSDSPSSTRTLVLYSKPGCCLCDGLKEKLQSAFLIAGPNSLHDVVLQIRDITTDPEWEKAYQYEIPVLARLRPDGTEEILPRLSPRLGVELIQKKIASALNQ
ncbi:hypothetical protein MLD38_001416 [Melastoma candidum]|uniref:Uncharacterized protein n=1 Tax=Melastoma candidum TaxID=119954 RepID=A0ACB9SCM5_9MYRT|nr:hypothetical protein MLD38_001416 [Melastoma candidum]